MNDQNRYMDTCETMSLGSQPKLTFEWNISENVAFNMSVKKTLYNRFKWWMATKLFLPGTYKWK